jgi:signal transduction histidine kinase
MLPLLKRIPPGGWTAVAWSVGMALTLLMRVRLPGEAQSAVTPSATFTRWDGLLYMVAATAMTLNGGRLLGRRPLVALGWMLAGSASMPIVLAGREIPMLQFLAVDVAVYFIAAGRPRRTGLAAAAMALGVLAAYLAMRLLLGWNVGTSLELPVALVTVIAWLTGNSMHEAGDHAEALRVQAAVQAVTAERLRIARELHDMVAHSIGIIALQAGAAKRVIDSQPAAACDALDTIETTGRETLSGLRRMLGALRQAEPGRPAREAPLDPAPGLADLDGLAATTTAAGVRVDVEWRGDRRPLPREIDMSAYRIVQEAVANVVRHAGTDSCRVSVEYREEELSIEVFDGGQGGGGTAGTGYGIVGMRERVGLLHGEFSAGPRPEGGFRVAARLPLPVGVR